MACTGAYATFQQYADFFCITCTDSDCENTINSFLELAAADIHAALAATGACDCTLANWAEQFLAKLNIIEAAAYYQCPDKCGAPRLSDEMRQAYIQWIDNQLQMLSSGQLDVCDGATGKDFPALGWAQQGWTNRATAEIIFNEETS